MDRVAEGRWRRVLVSAGKTVEASVTPLHDRQNPRFEVELVSRRSPPSDVMVADARRILGRCLGVDVDLHDFYRLARTDQRLGELACRFYGMRPPRFPSVFEALVNAIACQQLSLTVGIHLLNRLSAHFGPPGPAPDGATGFPTPERLADLDPDSLRPLGFSRTKAQAICALAAQVASGQLDLETLEQASDEEARKVLLSIPGIGRWRAEYTMLRGLGGLQVLPGDDVGARNNLRRRESKYHQESLDKRRPLRGCRDLRFGGAQGWT